MECCVEMSGASARKLANEPTHNSAWDGPCFRVTWMGGDASDSGLEGSKAAVETVERRYVDEAHRSGEDAV